MTIFEMLVNYFDMHIFNMYNGETFIDFSDMNVSIFGVNMGLGHYLSLLCAIICVVIIFVLCCLFIYKMIKLVGNLIR